ncbi:MAG: hypothetical protein ACPG6P_11985 [Akkermansiaceae bacterium]
MGGATWSPWNGVTLRDIHAYQADINDGPAVVSIKSLQAVPYWSQLLKGNIYPKEIAVVSPSAEVSVEMLSSMLAAVQHSKNVPDSGGCNSNLNPAKRPTTPSPESSETGKGTPPPQTPPPSPRGGQEGKPQPSSPEETTRPAAGLPVKISIVNGDFRLFSERSDADLLDVAGVSLEMPLMGEDASGVLEIVRLNIPGIPEINHAKHTLHWRRPYLEIDEQELEIAGFSTRYVAQLAVTRNLPFLFDMVVDPQKVISSPLLENVAIKVSAEHAAGRVRGSGALLHPSSWRGDAYFMARDLQVSEQHGGKKLLFEEVFCPVVFRQGEFRWDNVRATSEDFSILGNGRVSLSRGALFVTRVIVSPERAHSISRGINGLMILGPSYAWWHDLETPDRKYRDLLVYGSLLTPAIDAGRDHEALSLWVLVKEVRKFIKEEMNEEGLELKTLPNESMLEHHANH